MAPQPSSQQPTNASSSASPPTAFPAPVPLTEAHNHLPTASSSPSTTSPTSTASSPPAPAPEPTVREALSTIRPYDLTGIHLRPCARESLLTGIGTGFAIGGLRLVLGARQYRAMSWAVGGFCAASMGAYAFCREKRRLEKVAMERAREIMEKKQKEKMVAMAREKAARRRALEEQVREGKGGGGGGGGGGWWGWGGKGE